MIECVISDLSPPMNLRNLLPESRSKPGRLAYVGKASRLTSLVRLPVARVNPGSNYEHDGKNGFYSAPNRAVRLAVARLGWVRVRSMNRPRYGALTVA